MGRLAIIIVLGLGATLAIMSRSITGRIIDSIDNSTAYYAKTQAKNNASSAAEIYLRKLKEGDVAVGTFTVPAMMGGDALVLITSIDKDAASAPDTLKMVTIGTFAGITPAGVYGKVADTIINTLAGNLGVSPPGITGGLAVSNNSQSTIKSSGNFVVDGHNYSMAGTSLDGSCSDVNGLSYGTKAPAFNHSGTWTITGSGGGPAPADTQYVPTQPDYTPLATQLEGLRDTAITSHVSTDIILGDTLHPKITLVKSPNGQFSGKVKGAGILIIDLNGMTQDFACGNQFEFRGLVIVIGDSTAGNRKAKFSNINGIYGAVLLAGVKPSLDLSNGWYIRYSCAAINMAFSSPKLNGNYIVYDWWE